MYSVNCIKTRHGFFDVVQCNSEDYTKSWIEIMDSYTKKCVGVIDASLSDFYNKRQSGFLLTKLRKCIDEILDKKTI